MRARDGGEKEIFVAHSLKAGDGREEYFDPNSLSIRITVNYFPGKSFTPGVEEYGHMTYFISRKDVNVSEPDLTNSGVLTFFPKRADLDSHINSFFSRIRPVQSAMHENIIDKGCLEGEKGSK